MGFLGGLFAGFALSGLTTAFEEIERTRYFLPIGAGGGFDSLPQARQEALARKMPKWLNALRKLPPAAVTRELLKNARVAAQFGRNERLQAQARLMDWLVEQQLAADPDAVLDAHGVPRL